MKTFWREIDAYHKRLVTARREARRECPPWLLWLILADSLYGLVAEAALVYVVLVVV